MAANDTREIPVLGRIAAGSPIDPVGVTPAFDRAPVNLTLGTAAHDVADEEQSQRAPSATVTGMRSARPRRSVIFGRLTRNSPSARTAISPWAAR